MSFLPPPILLILFGLLLMFGDSVIDSAKDPKNPDDEKDQDD
jgi:hypothetical protein